MKLVKLCATLLLLVPAAAFAAGAFDGTWNFTADHVQLSKKPIVFVLKDGEFTCKTCRSTAPIKADGTDQKVTGNPNIDTAAITIVDANTVTAVYKLGGKTVSTRKLVVAADGKSVVDENVQLYGAEPSTYKERMTRISAGPAGSHALSGSWHESKLLSATGPSNQVAYAMTADGFTMKSNGQSYSAKFDDKLYPVAGDPTKTMVTVKKVSDTEVIETDSQAGKPVETYDMTVSADGKTLHVVDTTLFNKTVQHYFLTKAP